jgi:hypothetical protein
VPGLAFCDHGKCPSLRCSHPLVRFGRRLLVIIAFTWLRRASGFSVFHTFVIWHRWHTERGPRNERPRPTVGPRSWAWTCSATQR